MEKAVSCQVSQKGSQKNTPPCRTSAAKIQEAGMTVARTPLEIRPNMLPKPATDISPAAFS